MYEFCFDCRIGFTSWLGLKEHFVQSPMHDYCQHCNEDFSSYDELEWHYDQEHARCAPCRRFFKNGFGLHEHHRQSPIHASLYCVPCRRLFQSESNLKAHLNSSIHRPKEIACPGRGCGQQFVSQSALLLHLEGGACASGINRSAVNKFVRQHDTKNIITDPARLITGGPNDDVTYSATRASWNGNAYECYLCHNQYQSIKALNQHLNSPRHQNKIYICPLSSCRMRFSTLSALCQHIESERCGVMKFTVVKNAMDGLVGGMRRIAL